MNEEKKDGKTQVLKETATTHYLITTEKVRSASVMRAILRFHVQQRW